ncbi:MAG: YetF domain-containing protein [Bacillota bacterium]
MYSVLTIIFRSLAAFFTLLIFTRILGKQQISQLTFFDYILGITIGSIAGILSVDLSSNPYLVWVGIATWVISSIGMKSIALKSRSIAKYIDGEAAILIMNGQIMEENLRSMNFRASDLLGMMRVKGIFNPSQVEFAILETSGKLSVLKKSQHRNLTPQDMNLNTNYEGLSVELIYDGLVLKNNLKQVNLDYKWLENKINQAGIHDISDVFLATLDTTGVLYLDTREDTLEVPVEIDEHNIPKNH